MKVSGLFKDERVLISSQAPHIQTQKKPVLNLCANNYLGLANNQGLVESAKSSLAEFGFGMASVRFICGTHAVHKKLEKRLADFLGFDDCILFSSCFDANGGVFEALFDERDALFSDSLNHASIIDGIRLCKAARHRYKNNDLADLEEQLKMAPASRFRVIVTDGVFSMDGSIAHLKEICDLADRYECLVFVDDSHAVGFMGQNGRGTHEHCKVMGRVDIMTGTLGKALGGASGGYVVSSKNVIEVLRQKARPYLFSNTLMPAIASATLTALDWVEQHQQDRLRLHQHSQYFRAGLSQAGFKLAGEGHPIIPIMIGDASKAVEMASELLERGIYVIAFSFPVVPKGLARIRTQICASLTKEDLDFALKEFTEVGRKLGII